MLSVAALLLSQYSQSATLRQNSADRREDRFTAAVRDFGSSSETAQAAAIATLDQFWRDSTFRDRVQDLLIASVGTVRSPDARIQIQRQFIQHADSASISRLGEQNRALRARLAEINPSRVYVAEIQPPSPRRTSHDSLFASTQQVLGWNIATLVGSINRLQRVRGADLSGVVLSRFTAVMLKDSQDVWLAPMNRAQFAPGVTLESVNLSGAFLAGMEFDRVTFSGVSLDSANLTGTRFQNSSLIDGSSAAGFITSFSYWAPIRTNPLVNGMVQREAARWEDCTLDVDRFYPLPHDLAAPEDRLRSTYVRFVRVSWRIRRPPPVSDPPDLPPIPPIGNKSSNVPDLTSAY